MKVIHKFKLAVDGSKTELKLKHGYKIAHTEYVLVEKAVCIWVEQTLAINVRDMEVIFKVARSGDPIPDNLVHIATAVDGLAPEAYHILKESHSDISGIHLDYKPSNNFESQSRSA
jgi:hypothetical protein